jgi:hypothetical protein
LIDLKTPLIHTNKIVTVKPLIIAKTYKYQAGTNASITTTYKPDKIIRMTKNTNCRKERIVFLLPFLAVFFLICCQKEPTVTFGNSFVQNNSNAVVVVVDTLSVNLSTVYLDSIASAGTGTALVGSYRDNQFGLVNSQSFFQVAPASVPQIDINARYDSIALIMRINRAFYGDTTQRVSYKVNQLTSQVLLPYLQYTFFSNNTFPTDPTYLGSVSDVLVTPTAGYTSLLENDTIKIKMSDVLGQRLFTMLRNQSDTVKIANTFLQFFKGLCVSALDPNVPTALYGFKDSMTMRVYYHEPTLITTYQFADFQLINKSYQFNNITADRSATPLANLILPTQPVQAPPETPSNLTGNNAYLQPLAGLKIKITFPYLQTLLLRPDFLSILRAQLIVRPKIGTYNNNNYRLPPILNLAVTDQNNLIGSPLTLNGSVQTGSLFIDYLNPANTFYSYDLSGYIQQQAGLVGTVNTDGLFLNMPAPASDTSLNRLVLQDRFQSTIDNRVTLKVYYISLKQQF